MVRDRLGSDVFSSCDPAQQALEVLAIAIRRLEGERCVADLLPRGIGQGEQFGKPLRRHIIGDTQFVVGTVFIEPGLAELEGTSEQVFPKLRPLGDVPHPLEQVTTEGEAAVVDGVGGFLLVGFSSQINQRLDVLLEQGSRPGIVGHAPHRGNELLGQQLVERRPPRIGQRLFKFNAPLPIVGQVLLLDPGLGRPGLEIAIPAGILLPGTVVVGREHPNSGPQQSHRSDREHDVQGLEVVPCLFCCWHDSSFPEAATGPPVGGQGSEVKGEFGDAQDVP